MDRDGDKNQSDAFKRRLKAARDAQNRWEPKESDADPSANAGFKMGLELVSGVLVGAFLGFWIDRWVGTGPWGFILLTLLGFVAGVVNLLRATAKADRDERAE